MLKIGENVSGMNFHYNEIKHMFERAGIENFASLPEDNTVRARFAREWKALNARLDAAKMQGSSGARSVINMMMQRECVAPPLFSLTKRHTSLLPNDTRNCSIRQARGLNNLAVAMFL